MPRPMNDRPARPRHQERIWWRAVRHLVRRQRIRFRAVAAGRLPPCGSRLTLPGKRFPGSTPRLRRSGAAERLGNPVRVRRPTQSRRFTGPRVVAVLPLRHCRQTRRCRRHHQRGGHGGHLRRLRPHHRALPVARRSPTTPMVVAHYRWPMGRCGDVLALYPGARHRIPGTALRAREPVHAGLGPLATPGQAVT